MAQRLRDRRRTCWSWVTLGWMETFLSSATQELVGTSPGSDSLLLLLVNKTGYFLRANVLRCSFHRMRRVIHHHDVPSQIRPQSRPSPERVDYVLSLVHLFRRDGRMDQQRRVAVAEREYRGPCDARAVPRARSADPSRQDSDYDR